MSYSGSPWRFGERQVSRRFASDARSLSSGLASAGALSVSVVSCPACWPAYVGLMSSLGLGFVTQTPVLLPVTLPLLVASLAAPAYRAQRRRGFGPLLLGTLGAVVVVLGRVGLQSDLIVFSGAALLLAASVWNAWPPPRCATGECSISK